MQPYFFPYIGYFNLINMTDIFVFLDNVQFNRRGWIHRNKLFNFEDNLDWLTLPLKKKSRESTKIIDLELHQDFETIFFEQFLKFPKLKNLKSSNYKIFKSMFDIDCSVNEYLCRTIINTSKILGISAQFYKASDLNLEKQEGYQKDIINIIKTFNCDEYYNLPGGRDLYDFNDFKNNKINLNFVEDDKRKYSILETVIS